MKVQQLFETGLALEKGKLARARVGIAIDPSELRKSADFTSNVYARARRINLQGSPALRLLLALSHLLSSVFERLGYGIKILGLIGSDKCPLTYSPFKSFLGADDTCLNSRVPLFDFLLINLGRHGLLREERIFV